MSGAGPIPGDSGRPRRGNAGMLGTADMPTQSALEKHVAEQRTTRGSRQINFNTLELAVKKDFYDRASHVALGDQTLTIMQAADRVASEFGLVIDKADRSAVKTSVANRRRAKMKLDTVLRSMQPAASGTSKTRDVAGERQNNRKGRSGRKANDLDAQQLPSSKRKKLFKHDKKSGDSSRGVTHLEYQEIAKDLATDGAKRVYGGMSINAAAKASREAFQAKGVAVCLSTCRQHILDAKNNNGIGVSPQKPGGVSLPSGIEKKVAKTVRKLRAMKFPVFPDEIMHWAAEEISDRPDLMALFPPDGKPTRGWYRGWLKRMEFGTGPLRPLELTRAEWYTEENLKLYFEVAMDVLLKAGVAELNPSFDPNVEFSQAIIITHPERICSFDETRVELDCTHGGKGKTDTYVRAGADDDGEAAVTKSGKTATAVCGRTGDGKSLPVYIVFNSGEEYDVTWTKEVSSTELFDKEGNPLSWQYISNTKGSLTEEFCCDYMHKVVAPALGYPKHRDLDPGMQGVIVCDGVGTHMTLAALETAVDLGLEIVLRVPNLRFVLQGEDTINFKELKAEWRNQKIRQFTALNKDRKTLLNSFKPLDFTHFIPCFLAAWLKAFTRELNLRGWELEGLIPFTRNAFWKKRIENSRSSYASNAISPTVAALGSSDGPSPTSALMAADSNASSQTRAVPSVPAQASQPARGDVIMPENVRLAMKFFEKGQPCDPGILDGAALIARNLELQEHGRALAQWSAAFGKPKAASTKITSKDLFGRKGSATGAESLKLLREKNARNKAKDDNAAEKREVAKRKKDLEVAAQISRGSALLEELLRRGKDFLGDLVKKDLDALLQNAAPTVVLKNPPNKSASLAKVLALETVKAVLKRHRATAAANAAAAAAAAAAPPPSQPQTSIRSVEEAPGGVIAPSAIVPNS